MSTQLKLRRGTTAQHSTFTGAIGEITIDTDKKTVVVHDGTTPGGRALDPSRSNRIINGGMIFDQRNAGASVSPAGSAVYTVDRFKAQVSAGTFQRISSTISGYTYSLKYTSTGSNAYMQMGQQIEFLNCSDLQNQTVTISFRAKANNSNSGSTALTVRTRTSAAVDGSVIFSGTNADTSVTITTSDAAYSVTRTLPATFGALSVEFSLGSHVSGDGLEITGVQLEKGSVATPFEFRPYGTELALCQRYYQQSGFAFGGSVNTTMLSLNFSFPVILRASPTASFNGGSVVQVGGSSHSLSSISSSYFSNSGSVGLNMNTGTIPIGSYVLATQNAVSFSAEL